MAGEQITGYLAEALTLNVDVTPVALRSPSVTSTFTKKIALFIKILAFRFFNKIEM